MPSIASLIDQSAYPRFRGSITATDVHKHARFGMRIGANETSRVGAVAWFFDARKPRKNPIPICSRDAAFPAPFTR